MGCFFYPKIGIFYHEKGFSTANDDSAAQIEKRGKLQFLRTFSTIIFYHENRTVRNAKTAKFGTILVGRISERLEQKIVKLGEKLDRKSVICCGMHP